MARNHIRVDKLGAYSEGVDSVTPWASEAMVSGTAEYSQRLRTAGNEGQCVLYVDISSTGSPDMDINVQVSYDGINFHAPKQYSGAAGVYTALGTVVVQAGAGQHWLVFSMPLAPWIRFEFDPDANTTVTEARFMGLQEA